MFIEILPNSDTPIYTQLMYQIKIGILKREWSFGDGLPSVRSLASELGINMHTVNKAYNLLADEGVLVKNQKGYFVSERAMIASNEATKAAMQDKLKEILIDKQIFEVTDETFREWLNEIEKALKGEGKKHADLQLVYGDIIFNYYPRQINIESIKSGSSGFVDFSSLRELFGGSCICKARISKLPDATFTITDGIFRSVAAYGNNKITYGRGHVSNSSGQSTGSVTIPEGDRTDYIETYIRFDNVYEGGYYGQTCRLSFEINIDGGWKQVPPGGSYIMY